MEETCTGGDAAQVLGEPHEREAGARGGHARQRQVRQVGAQAQGGARAQLVVALVAQRRAVHQQRRAALRPAPCAASVVRNVTYARNTSMHSLL